MVLLNCLDLSPPGSACQHWHSMRSGTAPTPGDLLSKVRHFAFAVERLAFDFRL